jgi:hypothetical protein
MQVSLTKRTLEEAHLKFVSDNTKHKRAKALSDQDLSDAEGYADKRKRTNGPLADALQADS